MSGYYHPDTLLDMGKEKMQRYHQEQAAERLAQEAQNFQPGRTGTALNQVISLFRRMTLKLKQREDQTLRNRQPGRVSR